MGYNALFGVSMAFLVAGLLVIMTLVEEPRNRRNASV